MKFLRRPGRRSSSKRKSRPSPNVLLRVHLIEARELASRVREKNTKCEPYAVFTCGDFRFTTHTIHDSVHPEWDCWFDIAVSPDNLALDVVIWDRIRFNKDYLGEVTIPLKDLFIKGITDTSTPVQWYPLQSSRAKSSGYVSGDVCLQFSLVDTNGESNQSLLEQWQKMIGAEHATDYYSYSDMPDDENDDSDAEMSQLAQKMFHTNILDIPQDMRLNVDVSSESESGAESDIEFDHEGANDTTDPLDYVGVPDLAELKRETRAVSEITSEPSSLALDRLPKQTIPKKTKKAKKTKKKSKYQHYELNCGNAVLGVVFLEILNITDLPPLRNMTRTGFDVDPFVIISFGRSTFRTQSKRHTLNPTYNERVIFPVLKNEQNFSIEFTVMDKDKISTHDFVADGKFEIRPLLDLAPRPDPVTMLYDLQPIMTPAPLRRRRLRRKKHRKNNLTATDFDDFPVSSSEVPEKSDMNEYDDEEVSSRVSPSAENMRQFELPLRIKNEKYADKHHPIMYLRARFMPYAALRQRLWTSLLQKYDFTNTGTLSILDITQLLEYLNSTLSTETVVGWWEQCGRSIDEDLTISEAVTCLEQQIMKDSLMQEHATMKRRKSEVSALAGGSAKSSGENLSRESSAFPENSGKLSDANKSQISLKSQNSFKSQTSLKSDESSTLGKSASPSEVSLPARDIPNKGKSEVSFSSMARSQESLSSIPEGNPATSPPSLIRSTTSFQEPIILSESDDTESRLSFRASPSPDFSSLATSDDEPERVIRLETCPICNQPRFNKKAEMDIVTHLATCANEQSIYKILSSRFVSKSHAHKKWYTKIVSKVTHGNYRLGANSANILVQDRATGLIEEEKMSIYVRLGIRLLYKGLSSREMERKRVKRLLRSLTHKQGRKFDSPLSVKSIQPFIRFHNLDLSEVADPIESFKTFNEFFYRKLKPGARPLHNSSPGAICCAADSRATMYKSVSKASQIWIKGREFTISRLFGKPYGHLADKFQDCSIAIFRLAPQDYHRFHSPVEGKVGKSQIIDGEYYTVNPMAIRSALDVFGENVRVLTPIETVDFGTVMFVAVGAMMVGSTVMTVKEDDHVERGQELGYFQFGGSTCLVLFQKDTVVFDKDLVNNSEQALETLVRVGQSLGKVKA